MKTSSKQAMALLIAGALMWGYLIWQPDPDSPVTLVGICLFLVSIYFVFRYNKQIKKQRELGVTPEPTLHAKRQHFWTMALSLGVGAIFGTGIIIYKLVPIFGLIYSILLSIPYDLFMVYLIYWLWRKWCRV